MGQTFADISSSTSCNSAFLKKKRRAEQLKLKFETRSCFSYNCTFLIYELKKALSRTRDTSPGVDGITYSMLRHLDESSLFHLLHLFNRIWNEQVFPEQWRKAIVIPILKPGKDPEGVPQGSVLSVTLFILLLSQILKVIPSSVSGTLYVDDLQIFCQGSSMALIERQLQKAVDRLIDWVLSTTSWGADKTSLLRIYQSVVLSRIDYGCEVYGSARTSVLKQLDTVHHTALRICSGAFRTSPVHSLYVLMQPSGQFSETAIGICGQILTVLSMILAIITLPFSLFFCIIVVPEYERIVIFRLGRLLGGQAKGPGLCFVLPCVESYSKVDLRTMTFNVPSQEVLIKESVTLQVDAVIYYRVKNATASVVNVMDANYSTQLLAQTTLRSILGDRYLENIVAERQKIAQEMKDSLNVTTETWGIKVEQVEIKDVRLPEKLQRAMAAEAEATRGAKAKVITADGEKKASSALKEAAEIIAESPAALQLRYLQTLSYISSERSSTILFPIPIDFCSQFLNTQQHTKQHKLKHQQTLL
ncbi:LOW QUALITY PROTEIN: podocin-like, partial [Argiope bruennichi]|uniref:LOW QUALITY PROTEIN: podocin-like n=1 Tax=Argiope bruennichi TaxID=94029 RepID=UPI0024940D14